MKNFYESQKIQDFRFEVEQKIKSSRNWILNHKQTIIFVAPLVIGMVRRRKYSKNKYNKSYSFYDEKFRHYWRLKREPSNNDWVIIDKRKNNGENMYDILKDLKVLK